MVEDNRSAKVYAFFQEKKTDPNSTANFRRC